MTAIHGEIMALKNGELDAKDNPLKHAPHTAESLLCGEWQHPYSREMAAFPLPWVKEAKFWPAVGRIDNVYGDRHLVCTCDSVEAYAG
jgi:glycine dehydrogenase